MISWAHGYHSETAYTCGFYREMAPNWLDFAVLCHGHNPPRADEGVPFQYLELGSGMGLTLCLLAAAYPEGQFTGVDFHPDHIAHSQWLAGELGLDNVRFLEADFISLRADGAPLAHPTGLTAGYQYVAAHGIATWVTAPVQDALFAVASSALVPGGVFYCSYNTFPGWLGLTLFQCLSQLERDRGEPTDARGAYDRTLRTLGALLGSEESPSILARNFPSLRQDLRSIEKSSVHYLTGEYANEGWAPVFVSDMHKRCRAHKLRYVSTATYPELFEELLSESLHSAVQSERDPLIRQQVIDFATSKGFRRDIFVRGFRGLTLPQRDRRFSRFRFCLQEAPGVGSYSFVTSFGEVTGDRSAYSQVEALLAEGPLPLERLLQECAQPLPILVKICAMLIHGGRLGLDRGEPGIKSRERCHLVNARLIGLALEGSPYSFLVAPHAGSALPFTPTDALAHKALADGLQGEMLTACVLMGLNSIGAQLLDSENKPITNSVGQTEAVQALIERYRQVRLPALRSLGALEAPVPQITTPLQGDNRSGRRR